MQKNRRACLAHDGAASNPPKRQCTFVTSTFRSRSALGGQAGAPLLARRPYLPIILQMPAFHLRENMMCLS